MIAAPARTGIDATRPAGLRLSTRCRPRAFRARSPPTARYAERWAVTLADAVTALQRAACAPATARAAERAWTIAFADYLHLGAVYGLLPATLNDRPGRPPAVARRPRFTGLHRIELGLWTGAPPRSLVPVAAALSRAVARASRTTLPADQIDPLDYATRAHEILEDAQRDLMSGTQVPVERRRRARAPPPAWPPPAR